MQASENLHKRGRYCRGDAHPGFPLLPGLMSVLYFTCYSDPYFWHRGSLEACRLRDLPVITASHIDALHEALRPFLSETVQFMPAAPAQIVSGDDRGELGCHQCCYQ